MNSLRALRKAEAAFGRGNAALVAGKLETAEKAYREVLKLAPDLAEAHANLGQVLDRCGQPEQAEASYRQAIRLAPANPRPYINLGVLLLAQKRHAEAEAAFTAAIGLPPAQPEAWTNLGVLHASLGRLDEAERCHRAALAMAPDYRPARFNLAYVLLRQGRYEEGWPCLEARDWARVLEAHLPMPRWQGEPLAGRRVLIGCEAGHGDMIQFCRYAMQLKQAGVAEVTVLCHAGLKRLFGGLAGVDRVLGLDEAVPAEVAEVWIPALSLPHCCGTRQVADIPARIPYLTVEAALLTQWQARLNEVVGSEGGAPRVGLVWKGNPRFENDADRSLPGLATLAPLAGVAGVRFVSLQKGAGEDEALAPPPGMTLAALGAELGDFADTAALLQGLDLVIAVDTGVAHLAGALGKPCWVMLPAYKTDWRWLDGREDSPWYPGALRLFRQREMGDWAPVVAQLAEALRSFVVARSGT